MNIKLISPETRWDTSITSAKSHKVQKVSLPLLAALTPKGHTIKIVDEAFAPDDTKEDVDLVGITVMTELVPRAYRIADIYRKQGAKVVMGGIHPSVLPEEVLQHADAVVVGEAEYTWPKLVNDATSGKMQKIYRAPKMTDLSSLPFPKRDLYPHPMERSFTPLMVGLETSRGCPFDCEFCAITQVMGQKFRTRPIQKVIAEIESIQTPNLFFVDDSLGLNRATSKKLFNEMIPLKRRWIGQGTVSIAEDIELLRMMRRSGCHGLLIGFESVDKETQERMRKIHFLKIEFSEAMRRFHGEGIPVLGAFVFGFDHETKDIFDRTLEFAIKYRLDGAQLRVLTPFPGTRLYNRLLNEGRLFDPEWWLKDYPPGTLLYRPKSMTPEELLNGFSREIKEFYSLPRIVDRFFGISPWKRSAIGIPMFASLNLAQRKRYLKALNTPQPFISKTSF